MKRFRMKKQKIVKPDGRWLYMYTFEEEAQPPPQSDPKQREPTEANTEPPD